jgi:lysophospholipase L1-like esterase
LLSNLLACIFSNFRACSSPENFLLRTTDNRDCPQSESLEQKVVLIGSSNLKYSTPYFSDPSFAFVDNSVPGWMPTPENIVAMRDNVRAHAAQHANAFVFDLLGNSSVRFEQFDGSTSLPFKSQGRFHLGGKVIASPPDIFKKTISAIIPILLEKKDTPCVVVPPIPRYLFSRCCSDSRHCTNANEADYCENLLTGFLQQRGDLIKNLVAAGVTNFKVLDACCTTACATTANTKTRLTDLRGMTASDGVHFVAAGYQNLAARSQVCIRALLSAPPRPVKTAISFWRGFKSPIGSNRAASVLVSSSRGRGGGGRPFRHRGFHPYRKN